MISRLQEGDLESDMIEKVRKKFDKDQTHTLYRDRIFWLNSSHIEQLDYDIRVSNLTQDHQFKAIVAFFKVKNGETNANLSTTKRFPGMAYGPQRRIQTESIQGETKLKL